MGVYVDPLYETWLDNKDGSRTKQLACHIYSESKVELFLFAWKAGIKLSIYSKWSSMENYQIPPEIRSRAIRAGAVVHSFDESRLKWWELRGCP